MVSWSSRYIEIQPFQSLLALWSVMHHINLTVNWQPCQITLGRQCQPIFCCFWGFLNVGCSSLLTVIITKCLLRYSWHSELCVSVYMCVCRYGVCVCLCVCVCVRNCVHVCTCMLYHVIVAHLERTYFIILFISAWLQCLKCNFSLCCKMSDAPRQTGIQHCHYQYQWGNFGKGDLTWGEMQKGQTKC